MKGRKANIAEFIRRARTTNFSKDQTGPLELRLQLMESLVKPDRGVDDFFTLKPGTLTIVDLSDPFIDAPAACTLFEMCTALFLDGQSDVPKVITP